ncbi:MAG: permease [Candidatus Cloacimonetes bacterium]|nr:permease [Candidatus Cloacimonadota bacterium]
MNKEWKKFIWLIAAFLALYFLPFDKRVVTDAFINGFSMLHEYAREHVLLCLVPAFFIAGAITIFVKKDAVLKLLGPKTSKWISYPIASISGGILAVCSCTILPLFAGIWKRGAGIGPATAFLYAGPAINIAAIFLTGTVLGWEMSLVRLFFAIAGAILIGLIMGALFRNHSNNIQNEFGTMSSESSVSTIPIILLFVMQLAFLITGGLKINAMLKSILLVLYVLVILYIVFWRIDKEYRVAWIDETWSFTKKILPFLFVGVFVAGVVARALPENVVNSLVGGNRLFSTFFASIFGAVMYFATLTEVPIIQSLMSLGMGKGPALSLFLAGYSLSLPNIIVLMKLLGFKRAMSYILLIVIYSTLAGFVYGNYLFV